MTTGRIPSDRTDMNYTIIGELNGVPFAEPVEAESEEQARETFAERKCKTLRMGDEVEIIDVKS